MAVSKRISRMFFTYHSENLLLIGQANRPPTVGGFLAAILCLLGSDLPSNTGMAELLFLVPAVRADSRAHAASATCTRS